MQSMDISDFRRLFAYDTWANREVMRGLEEAAPRRSLKFMAHILAAERLWLERLQSQNQSLPVWPDFTPAQCQKEAEELPMLWGKYLDRRAGTGLSLSIQYKNSKGELWSSRESDILMHVITHSAYHRGQIAADMRAAGLVPAYTDFIHAVRQGLVE
jgi:uncharacterized damage-inducible protein DinB